MNKRGFSLLEMLVAVAIILILIVMAGSFGSKSHQQKMKVACVANLQQAQVAMRIYATENREMLPAVTGATSSEMPLSLLVPKYTSQTGIFICPGSKDDKLPEAEPFAKRRISYAYTMGLTTKDDPDQVLALDRLLSTGAKAEQELIFSTNGKPPANNHHKFGGNLLLLGGSVTPSGPHAAHKIEVPKNGILLNPKP